MRALRMLRQGSRPVVGTPGDRNAVGKLLEMERMPASPVLYLARRKVLLARSKLGEIALAGIDQV
jgi:hypothetical protein